MTYSRRPKKPPISPQDASEFSTTGPRGRQDGLKRDPEGTPEPTRGALHPTTAPDTSQAPEQRLRS
eukprot:6483733-Pyramimonas_sp.AAC.1